MKKFIVIASILFSFISSVYANQDFLELCKYGTSVQISNQTDKMVLILYRDDKGQNGLMYASMFNKNVETIKTLISLTRNIDTRDLDGKTSLMKAIEYKNSFEVIDEFLKAGASVQSQCRIGMNPLMYALKYESNLKVVELLLKYSLDHRGHLHSSLIVRDNFGRTPLHYATASMNVEIVKLCVTRNQDGVGEGNINIKDQEGNTPLIYSIINNNIEVTGVLLAHGADARIRNNKSNSAFDYAILNSIFNNTEILWKLNDAQYRKGRAF